MVASGATTSGDRDAAQIYEQFCSGCHGERLEGGKGPSLGDGHWTHGGEPESLKKSIRNGYPYGGMPAFSAGAINDAELTALIAYLQETATRKADPQPQVEQPLPNGARHSEVHDFRIETVAEGLDVPWSFAFLPDGRILATERSGRLRVIDREGLQPAPICGIPEVLVKDEAGLMSVVVHPQYAQNGWIYLSLSDPGPNETAMTKIVRGRIRNGEWVDQATVFAVDRAKYQHSSVLFGGRMVFHGPYLFFSVGERGMEEGTTGQAQDVTTANGKIHRVMDDGAFPADNPFTNQAGAVGSIWALGVRNPQGLAVNFADGRLWETEHGPRGGDELNQIVRGENYGWPLITFGMNYDGSPITDKTEAAGLQPPVVNWTPSVAVSEIEFYSGDRFPRWKGNLFVGSLAQQKFLRMVVSGDRVVHREEVFSRLGRVRDIKTGPDGYLYLALELIGKPGKIVRLVPADGETAP